MKLTRQAKILEIINNQDIETQNQLIDALRAAGLNSTQATVSRDIKELRLVKELAANGGYRYVCGQDEVSNYRERLKTIFKESVRSAECAQNIVVIRTLPGLASAACSALDGMNIKGLVGTLAGDDTAFLAMRDNAFADAFCREIHFMM